MPITHTGISLLLIILTLHSSTALDYELFAPSNVEKDKPFEVEIKTEQPSSEFYDVKIFITKHTREYSEIYNAGNWQSSFKYIQKAFPDQTKFQLRAHIASETTICSRLRSTEPKNEVFEICNPITVSSTQSSPEPTEEKQDLAEEEEPLPQKEKISETKKVQEKKKSEEQANQRSVAKSSPEQSPPQQAQQTSLNSNIIEGDQNNQIVLRPQRKTISSTRTESTSTIPLLFALTLLLIVILALLFFRAL